ncbi:MAG TPA: ParA family protein [Ktedonobacteraceae bacterium]
MRKISVLNFKGGVGKTSFVVNVGHKLALEGNNVLIVDCDLQGNASTLLPNQPRWTLLDVVRETQPLTEVIKNARPNLDVLPANGNLDRATPYIISSGPDGYLIIKNQMQELERANVYDFVLYDHSPSYSPLTESVLLASDEMIIPCELGTFSMEGLLQMIEKLMTTLTKREHAIGISGIVPFRYNASIAQHKTYLDDLRANEELAKVLMPTVHQDATIGKSQHFHKSVFEYDPSSRAAKDFTAICNTLVGKEATVSA